MSTTNTILCPTCKNFLREDVSGTELIYYCQICGPLDDVVPQTDVQQKLSSITVVTSTQIAREFSKDIDLYEPVPDVKCPECKKKSVSYISDSVAACTLCGIHVV